MAGFCSNCGRPIEGVGDYCRYCGMPVSSQQSAPPAETQQWPPVETQQWQPVENQQWQPPVEAQQWPPVETQQWQPPVENQQWPPAENGQWSPPRSMPAAEPAQWVAPRTTSRNPSAQITQAIEDLEDRRLDERQRAEGTGAYGPAAPGARVGVPAPGWSDRISDPELQAALAKQRRAGRRFAAFAVPIPLIGFAIFGATSDKMELGKALICGAVVSAIFLIFALIGGKKPSGSSAYEAVVVDKQTCQRRRNNGTDDDGRRRYSYYTELTTVAQTDDGQLKRIVEADDSRTLAWDYLQIGERFRYHPELSFPYELYNKSHAPCLYCVVCQKKNPVEADRCKKCGAPLLK